MIASRRRIARIGAAALAAPALPRFAKAAPEFQWRLGHTAPPMFSLHKRLVEAATEIGEKSGGRIDLKVHPDSALGGQLGLMAQVRGGSVEMAPVTGQSMITTLGAMFAQSVGFAFDGYDRLWAALDGNLGKALRTMIQERLTLIPMERCWDFGFRQITTRNKPVRVAADLQGLKIRTPIDGDLVNLFLALKAAPLGMNLQDLLPALQAGAVDAQDGILPLVRAAELFDQQSYCSMTNHSWDGQWLCVNFQAWRRLPEPLQIVVATAFDQAAQRQRADNMELEADVRNTLTQKGMVFNAVDQSSFRAALRSAGYYAKAKLRVGDDLWAVMEKYTGRLA